MNNNNSSVGIRISIGSVLAMILSWHINHSIIWAILHGIHGVFVAEFSELTNKWGGIIKCTDVISKDNPLKDFLK
jgi:hypothetical protein